MADRHGNLQCRNHVERLIRLLAAEQRSQRGFGTNQRSFILVHGLPRGDELDPNPIQFDSADGSVLHTLGGNLQKPLVLTKVFLVEQKCAFGLKNVVEGRDGGRHLLAYLVGMSGGGGIDRLLGHCDGGVAFAKKQPVDGVAQDGIILGWTGRIRWSQGPPRERLLCRIQGQLRVGIERCGPEVGLGLHHVLPAGLNCKIIC